jgi:hypothetical protein
MELTLSDQQRAAISANPGQPLAMDDERTQTQYVLVRAELFRRLQQLAYDDSDVTPEEMLAAAARVFAEDDDWDAPGMDDHNSSPQAP